MCYSMHSATQSYGGSHSASIIRKLNSNPTFLASKTTLGCRDLLTKLVRNPGNKGQICMNQRYNSCVCSSKGFEFSSEMSLKEDNDEFQVLNFGVPLKGKGKGKAKARDGVLTREEMVKDDDDEEEEEEEKEVEVEEVKLERKRELGLKNRRKQLMKRSSLFAKQVIGIHSALNLGFVSQLWVDTASWMLLEVEVRPSLLSSESGKVLLQDIERVGDVVLVQDQTFVLNEFRMVGLETLVGYSVVTPEGRNLGKVRGYTFNINSGAVESLELDAFGCSIIPSSLVSTYALFTEDVLQVVSDTIIVHETAALRIHRLTKGIFSTMMSPESLKFNTEYDNLREDSIRPFKSRKPRSKSSKQKLYPRTRNLDDNLDLPMDFM